MKGLSIVISADERDFIEYVKRLSPIISIHNPELILINNNLETIDIPCDHTIYKYSGEYKNLIEFSLASTQGKRVILLGRGLVFSDDTVDSIMKYLDEDSFENLEYNFKIALGNLGEGHFTAPEVIVYNRGVKGFNKHSGITISDFSLINTSASTLEHDIDRLLAAGAYHEIYTWYCSTIFNEYHLRNKFYEILEKRKASLSIDRLQTLENEFINSDLDRDYTNYLMIRKSIRGNEISELNHKTCSKSNIYYSWILFDALKCSSRTLDMLSGFDFETMDLFMEYLFKKHCEIGDILHEFISTEEKTKGYEGFGNTGLLTYINLLKFYIKNMSGCSETIPLKERLIHVLEICMKHMYTACQKGLLPCPLQLETELSEVFINSDPKCCSEEMINKLSGIIEEDSIYSTAARYYIQRLRYKYGCYKFPLSICLIVKNEEKNIERCLKSLELIVSSGLGEIILVDTGSTDKTIELAGKYDVRLYHYPWQGSFSKARNFNISIAGGEYIFIVDADEEFKRDEINKLIEEFSGDGYKSYNSFSLKLINYTDIQLTQYALLTQPRIFKNNCRFYYSSAVHNQPVFDRPIKNLDVFVNHYGYIMTEDVKERKFKRTASLLMKELEANPRNIYYRFQLSTSYAMHGDSKEALYHVDLYMRELRERGVASDSDIMFYNNAASIYIANSLPEKTLSVCDEALKINSDYIDFIYYKASILFNQREYEDAFEYINKYLSLHERFYKLTIAQDGRFSFYTLGFKDEALRMLIVSGYEISKYEECIKALEKLDNPDILGNLQHIIIECLLKLELYRDLFNFYYERVKKSDSSRSQDIFTYLVLDNLFRLTIEKQDTFVSEAVKTVNPDDYFLILSSRVVKQERLGFEESLNFAECYNVDSMGISRARELFTRVMPGFMEFDFVNEPDMGVLRKYKRFAQFFLHRANELRYFRNFNPQRIFGVFRKYLDICSVILAGNHGDMLENGEKLFLSSVLKGLNAYKDFSYVETIRYFKEATLLYKQMEGLKELVLEVLVPDYKINPKCEKSDTGRSEDERAEYSGRLGKELLALNLEPSIPEILKVFAEYNRIDLYTSELFSLKSTLLMSLGRLDDAKSLLIYGQRLYPLDSNIQLNLGRLYRLLLDDKKSIEHCARARMISLELKSASKAALLPDTNKDRHDPKILHGMMFDSTKVNDLLTRLNNRGLYTGSMCFRTGVSGHVPCYEVNVHSLDSGLEILRYTIEAASKLISEYDIFHFHSGTTLTFSHNDLIVLRELSKKIVMHYWGGDVRLSSKAIRYSPYLTDFKTDEEKIIKNLENASKYADCCIVNNLETYEYVRDYFPNIHIISPFVDMSSFLPSVPEKKDGRLVIAHAPSIPEQKGTKYISGAVEELKDQYDIEYRLIQGMSHERALSMLKDADIVIDQLIVGSYGQLAVEAMALGKPVICFINEFMKDKYPKELPIISADPDTIKNVIEGLINNRDMLGDIGQRGRRYVEKYHDMNVELDKLIELYRKLYC